MLFHSRVFAWYWKDSRLDPPHCKIIPIVMERKLENTVFCSNGRKVGSGCGSRDMCTQCSLGTNKSKGVRAELRETHLHDLTLTTQHTKKHFTQTTQTKQKLKQNSLIPWETLDRLRTIASVTWFSKPSWGLSTPWWCSTFDSTHTPQ